MNLLQYIGYEISSIKLPKLEYKRFTFTYIDKNRQRYDDLYVDIPIIYSDIAGYVASRLIHYSQNISLDEYEDRLSKQPDINIL